MAPVLPGKLGSMSRHTSCGGCGKRLVVANYVAVGEVLEGYVHLGTVASLGEEIMASFAAVMGDAALKVVRRDWKIGFRV